MHMCGGMLDRVRACVDTVKTLVTRHLQHASNLQTRRQKVLRRVSAFPSRYKIGPGDVLDLINWYTQFRQLSNQIYRGESQEFLRYAETSVYKYM